MVKPIVSKAKCTGCGNCVDICPAELFKLKDGKAVVVKGECFGCRACEASCPSKAIEVVDDGS